MTVALPILSACGHEVCILPSMLLSTHTGGFSRPAVTDLSAAIEPIFRQLLKPKDAPDVARTLHLADLILSTVPVYRLGCNVSEEAAEVAYGMMIGEPIPPKEQGEVK
jgi:hypothetical protein